jgi:hypothetical protein
MTEVKIVEIPVKVLKIPEVSSTTENGALAPDVLVTLEIGKPAYPDAPFYLGIMHWKDPTGLDCKIDMVQAVFSGASSTGDQGNVKLKIQLTGNESEPETPKFNPKTPVSLVPYIPRYKEESDLNCINVELDPSDLTVITISFLAPLGGQVVAYPIVYFLTDQGIIDPGLGAMRIPP